MSRATFGTLGPPHNSGLTLGPTREAIALEQVRRAGWPRLEHKDLGFHRHFVEHAPSGDLFRPHRGELVDAVYTSAAAYYVTDGGELRFLERPPGGTPQTVAELEQRRVNQGARRR